MIHTEWVRYIKTNEKNQDNKRGIVKGSLFGDDKYEFKFEQDMTTLTKQKLPVFIEKTKSSLPGVSSYNYNFKAHGIDVDNKDNVAQNGGESVTTFVLFRVLIYVKSQPSKSLGVFCAPDTPRPVMLAPMRMTGMNGKIGCLSKSC